ncbi:MAG: Crp/Fnr family transcriptional regulator [Rhodospirillales bacterium 20-60-12]|nr:MAG: Crp/Fnr family transcriptional regulator [Rhodospirillales bacterium 20-60-12]
MRDVPYVRRPITTNPPNSPTARQCHDCGARHIGLCDALSDDDIGFLARVAQSVSMPAGKSFIEEGSPSAYFYDINLGDVRVHKSLPDGRRQITGFMGIGHFLGLSVSGTYAFSAEALNDVQLCRFDRSSLLSVFAEFPAIEAKLLEVAVHEMVIAQEQMLLLGRKTALERVASFIDSWTERHAPLSNRPRSYAPVTFLLPMNRTDLADYLGLTPETVSRSFSQLKRDGLINFNNPQEISVLQPHHIAAMTCG